MMPAFHQCDPGSIPGGVYKIFGTHVDEWMKGKVESRSKSRLDLKPKAYKCFGTPFCHTPLIFI